MASVICRATSHRRRLELNQAYRGPIPVLSPPPRARIKMRAATCRRCFNSVANKASPWAELESGGGGTAGVTGSKLQGCNGAIRSPPKGMEVTRICDVYVDKAEDKGRKGQENGAIDQVWERCPTCGKLKKVRDSASPNSSFETIPEEE